MDQPKDHTKYIYKSKVKVGESGESFEIIHFAELKNPL